MFRFSSLSIKGPMEQRAKDIMLDFFRSQVSKAQFIARVRRFRQLAYRIKRRFLQAVVRRKHKMRIMLEYWGTIADVCNYLKLVKREELVHKYKGHMFHEIPRENKTKAIRAYLIKKEKEYCAYKVGFLSRLAQIKDARIRISSKLAMHLNEVAATSKATSELMNRVQTLVFNHYIAELNKDSKKNVVQIAYLQRQLGNLGNRERVRVLQKIDHEEQQLLRMSTKDSFDYQQTNQNEDSEEGEVEYPVRRAFTSQRTQSSHGRPRQLKVDHKRIIS